MKIYKEMSLKDFEFWGPAKDHAELLTRNELDRIERECFFEDTIYNATEINDFIAFSDDIVARFLGYEDWDELFESRMEKPNKAELCPTGDIECPYYKNGYCTLEKPDEDCDDYAYYNS